jgi:hypothetical protein
MLLQRIARNLLSAKFLRIYGNAAYRGIHKRWTNDHGLMDEDFCTIPIAEYQFQI